MKFVLLKTIATVLVMTWSFYNHQPITPSEVFEVLRGEWLLKEEQSGEQHRDLPKEVFKLMLHNEGTYTTNLPDITSQWVIQGKWAISEEGNALILEIPQDSSQSPQRLRMMIEELTDQTLKLKTGEVNNEKYYTLIKR